MKVRLEVSAIAPARGSEFTPARMAEEQKHFQAVRMLAATTILWGMSFPIVKAIGLIQEQIVPGVSSWFHAGLTGFMRFAVAGVVVALLSIRTLRGLTRVELYQGAGLGFFAAGGILFQMDGLSYTSASTSAFLTQTFCVLVPIIVAIRDRELPGWPLILAIVMVMGGVAVLSKFDVRRFHLGRGELETLISTIFFAGQIVWLERPIFRGTNANHFSMVMFLVMAAISLPIVMLTWKTPLDPVKCYTNVGVVILSASLTVFCTIGAFVFMNKWQRYVPSTEASIIYGAEPLIASSLALFLPGIISLGTGIHYRNEKITWEMIVGGVLIVGANIFLQVRWMRERRQINTTS